MDFTGKCGHICFLLNRNSCEFKDLTSFPGGSVVKNPPANAGGMGSIPGLGRSLEEKWLRSILAWRIHGQRSLTSYSPWGSQRVGQD